MSQHQLINNDVTINIYELNPRHSKSEKDVYAVVDPADVIILPK